MAQVRQVTPGISDAVRKQKSLFQPDTWQLIELFGEIGQITGARPNLKVRENYYAAVYVNPTAEFEITFNIEKEFIVLFSTYSEWFPVTLDAFDFIRSNDINRFERICNIVVSQCEDIEDKIRGFFKLNQESQIIIPFSYKELRAKHNNRDFIIDKFRKYFFSKDLFAMTSALQKDTYFFGRDALVNRLVSNYQINENSGIFGLRKTGKTSVLYSTKRIVNTLGGITVWIDCQDTSVYLKRWNQVLLHIIKELYKNNKINQEVIESDYTEDKASDSFETDILFAYNQLGKNKILLIFDEVEQITFNISSSEHWRSGNDFLPFWRTIRAKFQKLQSIFTYLISSTNPLSVEQPLIGKNDNPIYQHINENYINQFSVEETKEMISALGGYMGLKFDDDLYSFINRDYGGHPLLIRHVCSEINTAVNGNRPKKIKRVDYDRARTKFENETTKGFSYAKMILDVLDTFYPNESTMLTCLAIGDMEFFNEFVKESPQYTAHLLGYGIVEKSDDGEYDFKIDLLKRYLIDKENKRMTKSSKGIGLINNSKKKRNDKVFISYSHKDKAVYERLMVHLRPLIRDNQIQIWSDQDIQPGDRWERSIENALKQATVAILLISADFMASEYVSKVELPALLIDAKEKGTEIIPFFVKPVHLKNATDLTQYQGINSPENPYSSLNDHSQEQLLVKLAGTVDNIFNS